MRFCLIQIIRKLLTDKRNGDFVDVLCRNLLREVGYHPSQYCFWRCVNNVFWKLQVFLCADQHKVLYESVSVVTLWAGFKKLWNTYKQNLAVIVSCDIYHKRFTRNTGVRFGKKHRLSQYLRECFCCWKNRCAQYERFRTAQVLYR